MITCKAKCSFIKSNSIFFRSDFLLINKLSSKGVFSTGDMGNLAPTRKKLRVLNKNLISTQHPQYQNPKYAPVTSVIELSIEMLAI